MESNQINLNKYISSSGFCSRREADKLIEQARVTVNDELALAGTRVTPGDIVEVDGEPIKTKQKALYIACNKPAGVTSTTDVKDKTNIIKFLNHPKRIFPVGRLDKDSDGLILLTNDGDIVNKILRASNNHEKEYIVIVDKEITPDFIQQMGSGVPILNTRTKKCEVRQEGGKRFRITLTQGLNRQIRRMCEFLGYKVVKLTRIRIMNVHLEGLAVGHWRYLSQPEMNKLNEMMTGSVKTDTSGRSKSSKPRPEYTTPPLNEKEARDRARKEAFLDGKTPAAIEKPLSARAAKAKRLKEEYLKAKKNDPDRKQKIADKKADEDFTPDFDSRRPAIKKSSSSRFKASSHKADKKAYPERSGKPAEGKSKPVKKERPERGGKPADAKGRPVKKERPERGSKPAPAKHKPVNKRAPKR